MSTFIWVVFSMICEWLKEERQRLKLSQEEMAAGAGITRRPYADWESGKTSPTAVQLSALANLGVDVYYVLTGQRSGAATVLSAREATLVDNYRAASDEAKAALDATSAAFASGKSTKPASSGKITVERNHGQVIEGGQVNHGPVTFGQTRAKKK